MHKCAYLLHISALLHTNAYKCIFQFYRSLAWASSWPFPFYSFFSSQQRLHINRSLALPVNTLIRASGASQSPGSGACTGRGLQLLAHRPLPVDGLSLYLLRLESLSERTSTAQDYASPTAPAHPGSISSSSSSSRVSSNQPHFPTSCQLPATPMLLPHCAHFLLL